MRNRQQGTVSLDNGQPIVFAGPPVVQDAASPSKPPNAQLDPRWDWVEVREFGQVAPRYIRGLCKHLSSEVVPVESVDGETVAHLCQTCDTQLPAEWRVQLDNDH